MSGADHQRIQAEQQRAAADALQHAGRNVDAAHDEERQQRAVHSEDGARRAGAIAQWIPPATRDAARQCGEQVDHGEARAAKQPLDESAALVERVHVQRDVDQTEVQERRSQQPPLLAGPGQRAEVRAEADVHGGVRIHEIRAGEHHDDEHRDVDGDDRGRDQRSRAEHLHGLAETLVRRLVREELRRLLLREHCPQGFGVFARGQPHDDVVPAVARADQERAALRVVVDIGDVGERDARLPASVKPLR